MTLPRVVSREEWLAERLPFLAKEKEHSRARDVLHAQRQALPMFPVDNKYEFDTPDGKRSLLDLFEGRRQLIIYHFMLPADSGGMLCLGCSFWVDNMPHHLEHLHARDTSLVVDSPLPLGEFLPHKERLGWSVPVTSSFGTDFYDDFRIPLMPGVAAIPGITVFLRDGDEIYCTYATAFRGTDLVNNTYNYLDLTFLGRQEADLDFKWSWLHYHDDYDK
ncbi:DUF899 domain-containing protein [Saccharothrix longispora]|uniref:Dithiol-disulfide oxidoreductase (DUF899 family) n=1 Tax=Saccharothrix longispora TaxID=33920 RepID=A0ABU1PYV8_9PSEU|nr:DUF899 domain-containing protein [Saccharothrix longispora]MDR6595815.1 putative dithiol-disulfide oxidoreductase (DUF899 family) [Saccharothrix longispora]